MLCFEFPPLSLKKRQEHKIKQSAQQHIIQSVKKYPHIHLTACQTFQKLRGQIKSSGIIICIARTSLVGISTISTKEIQRQFKRSSFIFYTKNVHQGQTSQILNYHILSKEWKLLFFTNTKPLQCISIHAVINICRFCLCRRQITDRVNESAGKQTN